MTRWAVLVAPFLSGCVPDQPVRTPLDALLVDVVCRASVSDLLADLGAAASYSQAPPSGGGSPSVRVPTAHFAEWVAVTLPSGRPPILSRITPEVIETFRFRDECSYGVETSQMPGSDSVETLFTDAVLLDLIEDSAESPLVVYVWAPHMPLSPDGWPELQAAAQALDMRAVPALMAHSDPAFAAREAARVGMPVSGLREIASIELSQRQAQVHAPSIVIFGDDRVSPVLPGYRNAEGYLHYLEAFLGGR